jgi:ubiquitin-activating enzyme E1
MLLLGHDSHTHRRLKYGEVEWTLWDKIEFEGNPPLREIINWFQNKHGLELNMVSSGVSMIWSQFMPKKKVSQSNTLTSS